MALQDPLKLGVLRNWKDTAKTLIAQWQGSITYTGGNEYLTLAKALQLSTNPAGTPVANTLYKANIPKAWIQFNMATDAIAGSFNVSSITDGAAGLDTPVWDQDFSGGTYAPVANGAIIGTVRCVMTYTSLAVGSMLLVSNREDTGAADDATLVGLVVLGNK